ncbi:MAG: hypothetical protein M3P98_03680 [bacterium]|nr:hypothetical protein [bacterium]
MKKIKEAYKRGQSGDSGEDVTGRAARAAHRLGKASFESMEKLDKALHDSKSEQLDQAKKEAVGPTKKALEIIGASDGIPHQSASKPSWGQDVIEDTGDRKRQWSASFVKGVPKDPSRPGNTPLVEDLGTVRIDSTDWSHNGFHTLIDNFSLVVESGVDDNGEAREPRTTVWINTREYHMDDRDLDKEHAEGMRLDFDPSGELVALGLTRPGSTGYTDEDVSKVTTNMDEVLGTVLGSVNATAQEYQKIAEI